MATKGKFQAAAGTSGRSDPFAVRDKPVQQQRTGNKLWPILAAVAGVAVLVIGILILTRDNRKPESTDATPEISTVALEGMPRAELEQRFQELDQLLHRDLTLTLEPAAVVDGETEEPIVLTLPQAESGAGLDLTKLQTDLDAGVGQERGDSFKLDPRAYLVLNESALRDFCDRTAAEYGTEFALPSASLETEGDGSKTLVLHTGVAGRSFNADQLLELTKSAFETALIAEDPEAALKPSLSYQLQLPEDLDLDAVYEQYCTEPKEPTLNPKTEEVIGGEDGYGFDMEEVRAALAQAAPGSELRIPMTVIHPEMDAEALKARLFKDTIAEAHTNHTNIYNRTTNLKLACEAIDGTIVMPGEVFSFNKVVGERTEEKGYKEAIAYVQGGESKPEVGGGVCQVASSIYYAVLQADLKTVEREPHMFLVDYVPSGMDTTIYWGYLDYKFENDSPYPIKIEASVSGGKVHIVLLGTEWKDYTVELSSEVLDTEPWNEVTRDVPNDGTHYKGEVLTTPYTGYKIATYKTTRDKATGKKIETTQIAISRYNKRDKVIANPTGPYVRPTQPTQPPTQPTQPPTQPTQPPTQPTQPPTQPTQPPTQPTQPPTQPTEPPTQPTEPPTQPTEPPTQPTEPPTQPTEPPTQPTEPPTQPTQPPTQPTEPAPSESEGGGD